MIIFRSVLVLVTVLAFGMLIISLFFFKTDDFSSKIIINVGFLGVIASIMLLMCRVDDIGEAIIKKLSKKEG